MQILQEMGLMAAGLIKVFVFLVPCPGSGKCHCLLSRALHCVPQGQSAPCKPGAILSCSSAAVRPFLLYNIFASLQASTNIFCSSLAMLSAALGRVTPQDDANTFVENTLKSLSRCGTGSIDLWTALFQVLMVMKAGQSS